MKRMQTLGLVGLLTSVALTAVGDAERTTLNNWKRVVSTNDFKKALADIRTFQEEWPVVHSIKHTANKDETKGLLQTGYRDVARTFLQGLEHYEKSLREMSPEEFCEGAETLLEIRKRFMKSPSYVNYFLADSINRVVYINLGERLAKAGDVPTCYDKIVERLAEFKYDLSQLVALVNEEYGDNRVSMAMIKDAPLAHPLQVIGKTIGQENFYFVVEDAYNLYNLRILEKRSLTALLARLVSSDHFIGASLPALLAYRRKVAQFTPTDSLEKIGIVLGENAWLPPTLWHGQPHAIREATDFLDLVAIRSEEWRQLLYFSNPPEFTKERIERWEKEEAEREAQREAK